MPGLTGRMIDLARMAALLSAMRLELKGIKMTRGVSCYGVAKREFRLKGNKQAVLDAMKEIYRKARDEDQWPEFYKFLNAEDRKWQRGETG